MDERSGQIIFIAIAVLVAISEPQELLIGLLVLAVVVPLCLIVKKCKR
ncbi:MAG: hypothetical protein M1546_00375 [Chloroflexi bacterium]|nr:hypothetical protein [Chloroflexota bacterium]